MIQMSTHLLSLWSIPLKDLEDDVTLVFPSIVLYVQCTSPEGFYRIYPLPLQLTISPEKGMVEKL
jgi:hypothetical protein